MYSTLISPQQLHADLASVVVIDCRADLLQPEAGRTAYLAGHIPGAQFADLETDLSGPKSPTTGRHPLPNPAILAEMFGRWGVSPDAQVVAYDADNGMYAARLWWLLRWLGHHAVAVLNGGYRAWTAAALPTTRAHFSPKAATFVAHIDSSAVAAAADVAALIGKNDWRVLDARAPERFRGDIEPIDSVAGHIPGARNHHFASSMGGDGCLLPAAELANRFHASLDGVASEHSIMMCGSGVTACHNLLALEVAGLRGAKLYAGSWSEWIRDPSLPVEKGNGEGG
jgi:thiosulfate/3-mercaptopyruvate sulfurtransferase